MNRNCLRLYCSLAALAIVGTVILWALEFHQPYHFLVVGMGLVPQAFFLYLWPIAHRSLNDGEHGGGPVQNAAIRKLALGCIILGVIGAIIFIQARSIDSFLTANTP